MNKNRKKMIVGAGGVAVALSLALAALGPTGAYFSDTAQGKMTGSLGSIKVTGSGGVGAENLDLNFTNLLPGAPLQTKTVGYENTGLSNQDVWVVFNDAAALHALNDLGRFGAFNVSSNGASRFNSLNLRDEVTESHGCGDYVDDGVGVLCNPLPEQVQIGWNVAPNPADAADGTVTFGFAYPENNGNGALNNDSNVDGGGVWNNYPLGTAENGGLPYQIVATQVGQAPTN